MKIIAGLGCIDDYIKLVKAGADEVFCVYVPYEWNKKYGSLFPLNRREVLYYNIQINSLEDMKILKKMVDKYKVPVSITFNYLYYIEEQYEEIINIMNDLINIGLNILFIPIMGIEGAALATTISYFGLWLFHEIVARKIIKGYEVKIKYYMSACAIMLIAFFLSKDMYDVKMTRWVMIVLACVGYGMFALKKMKDRGRDKEKEIEN